MQYMSEAKFKTAATNIKKVAMNLSIQLLMNPDIIDVKQPTIAIT